MIDIMLSRQRSKESDGIDKPESGERLDCADVPESQMCKMKTCKITSVQYQLSSADALLQSVLAPHHSAVLMPASRLPELALPGLSTAAPRRDLALQTVKACVSHMTEALAHKVAAQQAAMGMMGTGAM